MPTTEPRTFRLLLEYDGTDFAGFQIQGKGERTVQGALETAIERLSRAFCRVHGAGRTDAGVHALGQVAHFTAVDWPIPPENLPAALNGVLARDLVVKAAERAEPDFHARYSATARVYRYVILNRRAPSALLGRFALHVHDPLDREAMRAAARHLEGVHDFAAFGRPDAPGKSAVREVSRVDVRPWKDCLLLSVRGNAFLRQMVRSFAGTLLAVGRGALAPDDVITIRDSCDRALCPPVVPAHGLCLVRVEYGGTRRLRDKGK